MAVYVLEPGGDGHASHGRQQLQHLGQDNAGSFGQGFKGGSPGNDLPEVQQLAQKQVGVTVDVLEPRGDGHASNGRQQLQHLVPRLLHLNVKKAGIM